MKKRQARTIRRMPPHTRQIAKTLNDMQTLVDRLDFKLSAIQTMELEARSLYQMREHDMRQAAIDTGYLPSDEDEDDTPIEAAQDEAEHKPKPFDVPKPPVNLPPL